METWEILDGLFLEFYLLKNERLLELYSSAPQFNDDLDGCICCKVLKFDQYLEIS